ncbi:MAG: hypothetical protein M1831_006305 [Alyxoria varia]|nr:MAG: hypothetical protein M1831_006305 [Alyxoria varia]
MALALAPTMASLLSDAFVAASSLLPLELRRGFVLVGGAALVRWGRQRHTSDLDLACSEQALVAFAVAARAESRFSESSDAQFWYAAADEPAAGLCVSVDLMVIGDETVPEVREPVDFAGV